LTDVSEVRIASNISLMMEAVHTSETSVHYVRYIPEGSNLHVNVILTFMPRSSKQSLLFVFSNEIDIGLYLLFVFLLAARFTAFILHGVTYVIQHRKRD
jgi:hypothetical protein